MRRRRGLDDSQDVTTATTTRPWRCSPLLSLALATPQDAAATTTRTQRRRDNNEAQDAILTRPQRIARCDLNADAMPMRRRSRHSRSDDDALSPSLPSHSPTTCGCRWMMTTTPPPDDDEGVGGRPRGRRDDEDDAPFLSLLPFAYNTWMRTDDEGAGGRR